MARKPVETAEPGSDGIAISDDTGPNWVGDPPAEEPVAPAAKPNRAKKSKEPEGAADPLALEASRQARIRALVANVCKQYPLRGRFGGEAKPVITASDKPPIMRLCTGLLGVDFVSFGGFPQKRITELFGYESCGKTTLVLLFIADAQRRCFRCFYYACDCADRGPVMTLWEDVEGTFDANWARSCGVNTDWIQLSQTGYAEADLDIFTALLDSGEFGIFVLDSIAQLSPQKELAASQEELQQGLLARLMNKAFRNWSSALNIGGPVEATGCTLILINQLRMKTNVKHGMDPSVLVGGEGQKYAASLMLKLGKGDAGEQGGESKSDGAADSESKKFKMGGLQTWQDIKVKAHKSKIGAGKGVGRFRLVTLNTGTSKKGSTDEVKFTVETGTEFGVLKRDDKRGWGWPDRGIECKYTKPGLHELLMSMPIPGSEGLAGTVTMWDQLRQDLLSAMVNEPVDLNLWRRTA